MCPLRVPKHSLSLLFLPSAGKPGSRNCSIALTRFPCHPEPCWAKRPPSTWNLVAVGLCSRLWFPRKPPDPASLKVCPLWLLHPAHERHSYCTKHSEGKYYMILLNPARMQDHQKHTQWTTILYGMWAGVITEDDLSVCRISIFKKIHMTLSKRNYQLLSSL